VGVFVVMIKQNQNYIKMSDSLVTSWSESSEADETSLNKHPTDSPSRRVSHKQASEDAHCYLPSVCSGNCNNRCTDMRSLNCSP